MESPSVAVVILNWNGKNFLERFLPSVLQSTYPNLKIFVGDNASTDDSVPFLQTHFPQVSILQHQKNEGFAQGYNNFLREIDAAYYVLLNSDVEVTESWIESVIQIMESDTNIAVCQPKIKDWNNKEKFEYAGAAGGWMDSMGYPFCRGRVFGSIEIDHGQYDSSENIFWASGAAMFIRTSVFRECGGFDPYFFAHMEEIDLCWRIQSMGYKIRFVPQSVVYHVGAGTLTKENPFKTYLNYRNNLIMLSKNLLASEKAYKIPVRFALDAISAWRMLFQGNWRGWMAVAKAHFSYMNWEWKIGPHKKQKQERQSFAGIYKGNIIWQYFVKGKKTFQEIVGVSN